MENTVKKVIFRNKEFKVVPNAKKVFGSMGVKLPKHYKDFSGIDQAHTNVIYHALGMSNDVFWNVFDHDKTINAVAVCDDRDEFDENTGIHVCAAKLEQKNHLKMAKYYDHAYRLLMESAAEVYKLCEKHIKKADAIEDDLVNYYGRRAE